MNVTVTRRRRSAASQRNEGARSHARSAPDFEGTRFSSCAIVQPSHPPHSPSADDTTCIDACLQSDTVEARLLQRCAPWHSIQQHPEATACSEQCSTDRSPGAKAISHQATTTSAALAAGSTWNHVQVGATDMQGPDLINASVSESSHQATYIACFALTLLYSVLYGLPL